MVQRAQAADTVADLTAMTNADRRAHGLPALATANDLQSLAQSRANEMARSGKLAHTTNLGSKVSGWKRLGENVGRGPNLRDIQTAFMASPSHRENILDPDFTQLGVGVTWDGREYFYVARGLPPAVEHAPAPRHPTSPPTTRATPPTTRAASAPPKPKPTTTTKPAPTTTHGAADDDHHPGPPPPPPVEVSALAGACAAGRDDDHHGAPADLHQPRLPGRQLLRPDRAGGGHQALAGPSGSPRSSWPAMLGLLVGECLHRVALRQPAQLASEMSPACATGGRPP